jgi:hypothetical protein
MMHKLQVKEHLRNGALYQSVTESSLSEEWKRRLFCQYNMHKQLKAALRERTGVLKPLIYIGVPVMCILLVFAAYFGFLQPGQWLEKIVLATNFDIPPIGLKEIFVFAALVNGLTFLIRERRFFL